MTIRKTPSQRLSERERDEEGRLGEADGPKKMENGIEGNKDDSLLAWGNERDGLTAWEGIDGLTAYVPEQS
jgi:hypothetical protein